MFVSRGENMGSHTQELQEQVDILKAHLSELDTQEKELDKQRAWLEENIEHLNYDPITKTYPSECLRFCSYSIQCSFFVCDYLFSSLHKL